ncbi:MAG: hypothetical protein OEM28_01495 [Nitrosopumilus sp.]|nr:hypothetical protein [Nitrosopumilus sp.]MDH3486542.1 hypothetical protein [Nitrosopumilus sp.]
MTSIDNKVDIERIIAILSNGATLSSSIREFKVGESNYLKYYEPG